MLRTELIILLMSASTSGVFVGESVILLVHKGIDPSSKLLRLVGKECQYPKVCAANQYNPKINVDSPNIG